MTEVEPQRSGLIEYGGCLVGAKGVRCLITAPTQPSCSASERCGAEVSRYGPVRGSASASGLDEYSVCCCSKKTLQPRR